MSDIQDPQVTDPANLDTPPADPAPTDPPADDPPQQHDTSWVPKRISEITAARRRAEEERDLERQRSAKLEEELTRLRSNSPTGADANGAQTQQAKESVEELAKAYAKNLREQERVNERIESINKAGAKEFGDEFDKAANNLTMAGVVQPEFLRILTNIDSPEKVVAWLGKSENMNEALRIGSLDPVQMGIEMMKVSEKANKAFAKQISRAPAPIEPVTSRGNAGGDGVEPDPSDQKAWIAWRNKSARKKR